MYLSNVLPEVLDRYLYFIRERHAVWERRSSGEPGPWSDDPILASKKFCNMFRVLDHGSQFVGRELLAGEESEVEVLFRAFLYRHTNRPEPFEFLREKWDASPSLIDLQTEELDEWWAEYAADGGKIFSTAYRVNASADSYHLPKFKWVLNSARDQLVPRMYRILDAETQAERAEILQEIPRVGPFMAMQILTDLGYSDLFPDRENELALIGPGSERGILHLTGGVKPGNRPEHWTGFMRDLHALVEALPDAPEIPLPDGRARRLSLTDVQNTLCEFDKYQRYLEKGVSASAAATGYRAAHPGPTPAPFLPHHW